MKFKVIEQHWYTRFDRYRLGSGGITPQECHDYELEEYKKEGRNYDGPFRYIEPCDDPGFPPREGLMYCVRINGKPSCEYYKPYQCYCYQLDQWWKYKELEYMFTELHIPQFVSQYEASKIKCPYRFLSDRAKLDITYHKRQYELDEIGRSIAKSMLDIRRK